jgi:predicted phage tail protein
MCFETFRDFDGKTLGDLLREELPSAIRDGIITSVVVALVLELAGVSPALVAAAAVAGFTLTIPVHLSVMVAGVLVLRWRHDRQMRVPQPS